MAQTYFSKPVSYGLSKYNMSSSTYSKKFSNVQSSGYGRATPTKNTRSYSTDRATSAGKYGRISGRVHEIANNYTSKVFGSSGSKLMNGGSSVRSPSLYHGGSSSPSTSVYNTSNSVYGSGSTAGARPPSGRSLPKGPGPHDERGRKIAVADAISQAQRRTGPVKATYVPSSYNDSVSDLERDMDRLSLNERKTVGKNSTTNDGSLMRSRKYGSTSSLKSNSTDR